MGYIRHHAIVVTSCNEDMIRKALIPLIITALINPLWYIFILVGIILSPIVFFIIYMQEHWDKIKDKKIF